MPLEPTGTALLFAGFATLVAISVISSRASERLSLPITLLLLAVGVIAGSEGLGGYQFENYHLAFRLGTAALVLILFDGGLNTPLSVVRAAAAPAAVLATLGVIGTALLVAVAANLLGLDWPVAMLLGAVVSSTDAAAVFAVLRGSGIHLKRRVGGTLEIESGVNDPMAVILTMALTANLVANRQFDAVELLMGAVTQIAIGAGAGWGIGLAGRLILTRLRLPAGGLYPVLSLAIAFFAFGAPTLVQGSGFLAVYIAGIIIGNAELPYRTSLVRVHDAVAWLAQIGMFLMLGLLVFPSRMMGVAIPGLVLAIFLAVVARPLVVALCLVPFGYARREIAYVGWVGLRGAVPIILATFPVLAGLAGAERLFDLVFFIVVANAIIPGATVGWVTRRLGLESDEPPAPRAILEIESMYPLEGELTSFYVDEAAAVCGETLAHLPFPEGAAVTMIVRGNSLIPPKGSTRFMPGDHVYVLANREDRPFVHLIFGRPEEE